MLPTKFLAFSSNNPISKMLIVNERELWCGCQNQIRIVDIKTHEVKSSFTVSNDAKRQVNITLSRLCGAVPRLYGQKTFNCVVFTASRLPIYALG